MLRENARRIQAHSDFRIQNLRNFYTVESRLSIGSFTTFVCDTLEILKRKNHEKRKLTIFLFLNGKLYVEYTILFCESQKKKKIQLCSGFQSNTIGIIFIPIKKTKCLQSIRLDKLVIGNLAEQRISQGRLFQSHHPPILHLRGVISHVNLNPSVS